MAVSTTAIIGAGILAGGSILSAKMAAKGAKSAADTQAMAILEGIGLQREMWQTARDDMAPWRETGRNALAEFGSALGLSLPEGMEATGKGFTKSPGYEFRLGEGVKALDASASARGRLMGGAQKKALTRFGQEFGSNEYGTWMNRLAALAQIGQSSAHNTASLGTEVGGRLADLTGLAGQAQAAGVVGATNAWTGAIDNITQGIDWKSIFASGGSAGGSAGASGGGGIDLV